MKDAFTIIGSLIGIIVFVWKITETLTAHVNVKLSTTGTPNKDGKIRIEVGNSGPSPKRIAFACMVIFPYGKSLDEVLLESFPSGAAGLPPLMRLYIARGETRIPETQHRIVPLLFLFAEQSQIGNESVSYEIPVAIPDGLPSGFHEARVIIFSSYLFGGITRWRQSSILLHHEST